MQNVNIPCFFEVQSSPYSQLQILIITAMKSKLQQQSKCLQSWLSQHTVSYHILCLYTDLLKYTHCCSHDRTEGKAVAMQSLKEAVMPLYWINEKIM